MEEWPSYTPTFVSRPLSSKKFGKVFGRVFLYLLLFVIGYLVVFIWRIASQSSLDIDCSRASKLSKRFFYISEEENFHNKVFLSHFKTNSPPPRRQKSNKPQNQFCQFSFFQFKKHLRQLLTTKISISEKLIFLIDYKKFSSFLFDHFPAASFLTFWTLIYFSEKKRHQLQYCQYPSSSSKRKDLISFAYVTTTFKSATSCCCCKEFRRIFHKVAVSSFLILDSTDNLSSFASLQTQKFLLTCLIKFQIPQEVTAECEKSKTGRRLLEIRKYVLSQCFSEVSEKLKQHVGKEEITVILNYLI